MFNERLPQGPHPRSGVVLAHCPNIAWNDRLDRNQPVKKRGLVRAGDSGPVATDLGRPRGPRRQSEYKDDQRQRSYDWASSPQAHEVKDGKRITKSNLFHVPTPLDQNLRLASALGMQSLDLLHRLVSPQLLQI